MTKRWATAGGVLAVLGLAVPALVAGSAAAAPAALVALPLPIEATTVTAAGEVHLERTFSGEVRARRATDLAFEVPGRVALVLVDEGQHVEAGALLARLDERRLAARHAELAAQRAQARAQLDELEAGPRVQTVDAARARVVELEHELALATRRRERRASLLIDAVITEEERDDVATRERTLTARLAEARAALAELEEGTRSERLVGARAAVARLDAALDAALADLEDAELRAPYEAIVARRSADEGAFLAAGEPILRLVENAAPEVTIGLPVDLAATLAAGDRLALEAAGARFHATVTGILPEVDGAARSATVVLLVDDDAPLLLPRQTVRLVLEDQRDLSGRDGVWVPTTALARGSRGLWVAYALADRADGTSVIERRDLEVLHVRGGRALVRGVIAPGDRLVADGLHRIVPGQLVVETPEATVHN